MIIAACIPLLKPLAAMTLGAGFLGTRFRNSEQPPTARSNGKLTKSMAKHGGHVLDFGKLEAGSDTLSLARSPDMARSQNTIECRTDIHIDIRDSDQRADSLRAYSCYFGDKTGQSEDV